MEVKFGTSGLPLWAPKTCKVFG